MTGWSSLEQQADAHHLHAVRDGRNEAFVGADGRLFMDAHHQRNARPVNVAVQQADFRAEMRQRAGEIGGAGGFADAALAAGDGDDALHAGNLVLIRKWICRRGLAGGGLAHFDVNVIHAGQSFQNALAFGFDLLRGFGIRRGQLHRHAHRAVRGGDFLDEAEGNDVARKAGILDGLQRVLNVCLAKAWPDKMPFNAANAKSISRGRRNDRCVSPRFSFAQPATEMGDCPPDL